MTSYSYPPNSRIAQDKPIKAEDIQFIRDNPLAIAEGSSGAPKIADKVTSGNAVGGGTVTFTDLDEYSGAWLYGGALRTGASDTITLEFSTDGGSSWSSPEDVFDIEDGESAAFFVFFDFASGEYHAVGSTSDMHSTGTISGTSTSIDALRLDSTGAEVGVIIMPQGGQSA